MNSENDLQLRHDDARLPGPRSRTLDECPVHEGCEDGKRALTQDAVFLPLRYGTSAMCEGRWRTPSLPGAQRHPLRLSILQKKHSPLVLSQRSCNHRRHRTDPREQQLPRSHLPRRSARGDQGHAKPRVGATAFAPPALRPRDQGPRVPSAPPARLQACRLSGATAADAPRPGRDGFRGQGRAVARLVPIIGLASSM